MEQQKRPKGRPPKDYKRDKKISIRVTVDEYNALQQQSKQHGTSLTQYIIDKCL